MDQKDIDNFWDKVDLSNDCWNWIAGKFKQGYGQFYYKGRSIGAHRISYEITNGPIPKGMFVCHKCDNPSCVNPAHLFLGTQFDNMRDMVNKGRHYYQNNSYLKTGQVISSIVDWKKTKLLKEFDEFIRRSRSIEIMEYKTFNAA